jgi:hypothetical protein
MLDWKKFVGTYHHIKVVLRFRSSEDETFLEDFYKRESVKYNRYLVQVPQGTSGSQESRSNQQNARIFLHFVEQRSDFLELRGILQLFANTDSPASWVICW